MPYLLPLKIDSSYLSFPFFLRDVDKVHDMMDDIAEQQDVAREISEAISNPVAFGQDIDEVFGLIQHNSDIPPLYYVYFCLSF